MHWFFWKKTIREYLHRQWNIDLFALPSNTTVVQQLSNYYPIIQVSARKSHHVYSIIFCLAVDSYFFSHIMCTSHVVSKFILYILYALPSTKNPPQPHQIKLNHTYNKCSTLPWSLFYILHPIGYIVEMKCIRDGQASDSSHLLNLVEEDLKHG